MKNLITQWRNMKKPCLKYGILIVVLALDVSCGVIQLNPATTTPEDPVCARPGFEDSFICAKLQELGVEYAGPTPVALRAPSVGPGEKPTTGSELSGDEKSSNPWGPPQKPSGTRSGSRHPWLRKKGTRKSPLSI